tara:strand:- start:219 stop:533 length:315 start_codon:yes stop_codon:yes gene_type:complete
MKVKQINKKVDGLLINWLKSIVSDEEQEQITLKNYNQFLPKEEYIESKRTFYLSLYTRRWAKQNIKKLLKLNYKLKDITLRHLEDLSKLKLSNKNNVSIKDLVL